MSIPEIDSSLLELFREEVRGQVNVLNQGLVELERASTPGQVEPLMRAAHSIKGAARLIGVDPAVKLAHAMEDCLVAVQQGSLQLTSSGIDVLLASTDWLGQFGEAAGTGFEEWFKPHQGSIADMIRDLECVLRGEDPGARASASGPHAAAQQAAEPVVAANPPATSAPISWKTSVSSTIDPAALDMFRTDIDQGFEALKATVDAWKSRPLTADELAKTQSAIKGMRGVAMLLSVEPLAKLFGTLEAKVQTTSGSEAKLSEHTFASLERALTLQRQLTDAVGANYEDTVATLASEIDEVFHSLAAQGESPIRAPMPATSATIESAPLEKASSAATPASAQGIVLGRPSAPSGTTAVETPTSSASSVPAKAPGGTAQELEDGQGRVVRVTAKNLNRLMGLAGESLVEARWLQPFAQSLLNLKREQDRLTDVIDELAKCLSPQDSVEGNKLIHDLQTRMSLNREMLGRRIEEFESHARRSDDLNSRLYNEVIASRMRPMSDGVQGYPRMIRDISRQLGKSVNFEIVGETTPVDRDVLEKLDAPLNHILRNAIDHGIESPAERVAAGKPETATLRLEARHSAGMFAITISDDGRGIDLDKLRAKILDRKLSTPEMVSRMTDAELFEFLFLPGFSTRGEVTELSGRGVGLDVVHTMATSVGGTVRIQSKLGAGTSFHLNLPITLSVIRAVLVDVAGEPYAFPLNRIDRLLRVSHESIGSLEHRQFLRVDGQNVGVVLGTQMLRMNKRVTPSGNGLSITTGDNKPPADDDLFVVLFSNHADQYGLLVDGFLGEQDLVVRPLDHRLGKVPSVSAAAVLDDGSPALIIDVDDVRRTIERTLESGRLERTDDSGSRHLQNRKKKVLVVDDSITVREVERQLLTSRGYEVTVAVDGVDGWNLVREGEFDLVISDVDMPHMNGLELTKRIKDDTRLQVIPVVIVSYKDREEDRLRGLEAGANYYLTKSSFHDESLIDAVYTLIGESQ